LLQVTVYIRLRLVLHLYIVVSQLFGYLCTLLWNLCICLFRNFTTGSLCPLN